MAEPECGEFGLYRLTTRWSGPEMLRQTQENSAMRGPEVARDGPDPGRSLA